jgi:ketosteroid isomerase-like protein
MSQENVEIMRVLADYFLESARSDREPWLARVEDAMDPAIEWDASEALAPDLVGVYRGKDAVIRWWPQWLEAWETVESEYEFVDAGDQVVALLDQRMRGRITGIEVSLGKYAHLARFKDGRMVHWKLYMSQSKALEAAGLSE